MERTEILKLKQSGMTYEQIGSQLGLTRQRAMQLMNGDEGLNLVGSCQDCGRHTKLQRHHESYWPEQVVRLCQPCHGRRHVGKFMRHKKVIDLLPSNASLTKAALAKKLGVHIDYAATIGRKFGFECVQPDSVPWKNVNWEISNKLLARVWKRRPEGVSAARAELKAGPPLWHWRTKIVGEFRVIVRAEISKRRQWLETVEIIS